MKLTEYLRKIQGLPLIKRKVIFWIIIIISGLSFLFIWCLGIKQSLESLKREKPMEQIKFPNVNQEIKKLPQFPIDETKKEVGDEINKELENLPKENEPSE